MKAFFTRIWMAITWPFRAIARGWRNFINFFTEVPEEVSLTETVSEALTDQEGFWGMIGGLGEHIDALRMHILRSVIALAITTGVCLLFTQQIMDFLAVPLGDIARLNPIEPTESIGVYMRVGLLAGLALAMPWIVLEVYLFVAPGLMPRSRITLLIAIPAASILFLAGLAFTYYAMLPPAISFLYTFGGFTASWRPQAYFGLITALMFWIGVSFQMPMLIYSAASLGFIKAKQLIEQWKAAIIIITIIAAIITPTVDPVNQALVMAPMIVLYGLSIIGAWIAEGARNRGLARKPAA